ncbi:hypothetical protein BT96DRAFT_950525 [Gymnopus androsaceus JB14]|uniref:Uncharacterized protein n=1 Tax=Gymnopus androsaceus JB14 TaxID=1447944 RepID=A0A6A4GGM3_9AGAR|nr:hypothetical protein BT96DRAFT_950525 [Gymnopus androsaceus JB14]
MGVDYWPNLWPMTRLVIDSHGRNMDSMTKISKKLEIHNSLTRELTLILMGMPSTGVWTVVKTHRPEIVGGKSVVVYDRFLKLTEQAQNVYNVHEQASFLFERGRAIRGIKNPSKHDSPEDWVWYIQMYPNQCPTGIKYDHNDHTLTCNVRGWLLPCFMPPKALPLKWEKTYCLCPSVVDYVPYNGP